MAQPSPQQVGREFVRQYYTVLHEAPELLHRFYSSGSTFVHGGVDRPAAANGGGHVEEPVVGQLEIDKKIRSLGFKDCHTKIRQVDAQATIGSGVVVQVTGELSNNGEPMRRFMQTFVLAPQTPKKFYVHNDIFRYQDEVYQDVSDTESEEVHVQQQQQQQQAAPVELKQAEVVVDASPSNNVDEHHHHHHVEQVIGSSASSTTSSTSSASVPAESAIVENHVHHEPPQQPPQQQHEEKVVVPQQATIPQEVETRKADAAPSKENGSVESSKPSSWARIIGKGEPGSAVAGTTTTAPQTTSVTAAPTATSTTNYSSNSLPRSNNKENRNSNSFNKQNGSSGSGQFNGQQKPSKPRNTNSFGTSATNTNAATPATAAAPLAQQQQGQQQQSSSDRRAAQNGGSEAGGDDSGADGADKRFAGSNRHPDTHQVFVGNLSQDLSDAELKAFFNQFGRVVEVRINSNTKQQSGRRLPNYGFVVFDDARAVENVLSSTKGNNLTLKNDKGEFRLNIEEKRARQGRQSSGFGGGSKAQRSTRSTSNGSNGNGSAPAHVNGKKAQYNREAVGDDAPKRTSTASYQRRS